MISFITVLIAIVAILLIVVILIQNPKGGGIDSTFGGSANQIFGVSQSTEFVEKATWILGAILGVLCIVATLIPS